MVLGNGGTTAFWDIAAFGLIRDRAQSPAFGEFGAKFAKAAKDAPFLGEPTVHQGRARAAPPALVAEAGVDVYAHAAQRDLDRRRRAGQPGRPAPTTARWCCIDATSGAGGLPVDLGRDRRLLLRAAEVLRLRRRAVDRADVAGRARAGRTRSRRPAAGSPRSSTWRPRSSNSRLDQTYNTPALATLFLLAEQIDWMNAQGGLAWAAKRTAESAAVLYGWAEKSPYATPFVTDPALRSQVVGTIDFADGVDAAAVAKVLRANGIVDTEPYRKLGRNQLRIAMFPAVDPADVEALTACIDYVVERL